MGWEYQSGADMSGYKYLVIKLAASSSDSHLNIFTEGSIWSPCCSTDAFGSKRQIVLNLKTAKYTSDGDKKGLALDTKNIRIVCFWGTGNQTIKVSDMYLTNNNDYSREEVTGISKKQYIHDHESSNYAVYNLAGQRIREAANNSQSIQTLPAGIYIVGNRKIVVK